MIENEKLNINVTLTGKEYLKLLESRNKRTDKFFGALGLWFKKNWFYIGLLFFGFFIISEIISLSRPKPIIEYINVFGIIIMPETLFSVCLVLISLGITIHGIAIIRR